MKYLPIKTLYLELTHACNQHCRHCYLDGGIHRKVEEMSTEQITGILKEFHAQGGRYLILTGGEPFMRKDIFDILDCAEELKIPFNLASNSLAMNDERLKHLVQYQYLDLYFTSILGKDAKQHKYIAGKDSYQKVIDTIRYLDNLGINTYVQITLVRDYMNEIEEIAECLLPYQNCTMKFTPVGTLGVKEESAEKADKDLLVPEGDFTAFHRMIEDLQSRYPGRIEDANIQNYDQVKNMILDYESEELYALCYGFLAVRPDGTMSFSCNMGNPYTFGKAYDGIKIPVDEKLREYIQILRKAEQLALEDAKKKIIEVDVTVDSYIRMLHDKQIG